jgi:hypothetical protein
MTELFHKIIFISHSVFWQKPIWNINHLNYPGLNTIFLSPSLVIINHVALICPSIRSVDLYLLGGTGCLQTDRLLEWSILLKGNNLAAYWLLFLQLRSKARYFYSKSCVQVYRFLFTRSSCTFNFQTENTNIDFIIALFFTFTITALLSWK